MLPIHTILFATDFSESAQWAFPLACSLGRDSGARVVVLYVLRPPLWDEEIQAERHPEEYYEGAWEALRRMQAPDDNVGSSTAWKKATRQRDPRCRPGDRGRSDRHGIARAHRAEQGAFWQRRRTGSAQVSLSGLDRKAARPQHCGIPTSHQIMRGKAGPVECDFSRRGTYPCNATSAEQRSRSKKTLVLCAVLLGRS